MPPTQEVNDHFGGIFADSGPTRSVCIIGAGAAGLCALRHFTSLANQFGPVQCFEQTNQVGGTWIYNEQTDKDANGLPLHTSMYRDLQ